MTCSKHEALYITQVIKVGFCLSSKLSTQQFSTWMFVSCLFWFHGFWRTFEAAGCVPSVMSQPQKKDCHTLQRVDLARPFLVLPAIKIEIENNLKMVLSRAKSGSAWQCHFGSVEPCDLLETRSSYITQVNQSWVLFKQQASTQQFSTWMFVSSFLPSVVSCFLANF